ncbi:hypothetical protein XA68_12417 [Ophiocordyceps unilateralis]|uniref:rRNA methyltransferase 1, mitochondrial n=1 Tax=Ophiocordyceps unilateralis TaxID=268505 RepID=A0A2A9PD26_OPHUN|nr:hypothetical protein XA68_12417 [Ophiocordyceps unilateralis]
MSRVGWRSYRPLRRLLATPASSRLASSLSSIMTGLRRTAKAEDRRMPAWSRKDKDEIKIPTIWRAENQKKSKDEEDEKVWRPSRRKRFNDPNDPFGKKSFVYQIKQAALGDQTDQYDASDRGERSDRRDGSNGFSQRGQPDPSDGPGRRDGSDGLSQREPPDQSDEPDRDGPGRLDRPHRRDGSDRLSQREPPDQSDEPDRDGPGRRDRPHRRDGSDRLGQGDRPSRQGRSDPSVGTHQSGPSASSYFTQSRFPTIEPRLLKLASKGHGPLTEVKYTAGGSIFIYGKNAVKAALRVGKRKLHKLYILRDKRRSMTVEETIIHETAVGHGMRVEFVEDFKRGMLDKMSGGRPHNGYVLEASPLPQKPVLSLCEVEDAASRLGYFVKLNHQSREEEEVNGKDTFIPRTHGISPKPFVMLLNNVVDPGNLGALVRSANFLGVDAVAITDRQSASIDSVALKASAGAAEEITLFSVSSAVDFIEQSKTFGWVSYAAVSPPTKGMLARGARTPISPSDIEQTDPLISHPCILVLGNEGLGIAPPIKAAVHHHISIPTWRPTRTVDSLNVSVAGALLCESFLRASKASETMIEAAASRWKQSHAKNSQKPPSRPEAPLSAQTGDFGCIF